MWTWSKMKSLSSRQHFPKSMGPQGQVTLKPTFEIGPKLNLCESLCLSSLYTRLMKILSAIKVAVVWTTVSTLYVYGTFLLLCTMETKVLPRSDPKPNSQPPTPVMVPVIFDQDWPTDHGDIFLQKCGWPRSTNSRHQSLAILKVHFVSLWLRSAKLKSVKDLLNDAYTMFLCFFFLIFFIKTYAVCTYLNSINKLMQFKWAPTTYRYAFIEK